MKHRLGPYSRPSVLLKLDGRTVEGRLVRDTHEALTAHVGGNTSATERALINRAVQLTLRVEAMDRKFSETGAMTEHDTRTYLAWSASLARILLQIGLKGAAQRQPTLSEYKAARAKAA